MGHKQKSVDMQSINLRINSIFTIFAFKKKKDLSDTEDITFAMRNRQEWFNEKMAAVSPEIVSYFFASNALLTIVGGGITVL